MYIGINHAKKRQQNKMHATKAKDGYLVSDGEKEINY